MCGSLVDLGRIPEEPCLKSGAAGEVGKKKLRCTGFGSYLEKQCGFPHNNVCDSQDRPEILEHLV